MKMARTNIEWVAPVSILSKLAAGSRGGRWRERAFRLYPRHYRRVPHISLVFREMWDTTALARNSHRNADLVP
jgi:hypothetical protein